MNWRAKPAEPAHSHSLIHSPLSLPLSSSEEQDEQEKEKKKKEDQGVLMHHHLKKEVEIFIISISILR
jgi:hypothetical protein